MFFDENENVTWKLTHDINEDQYYVINKNTVVSRISNDEIGKIVTKLPELMRSLRDVTLALKFHIADNIARAIPLEDISGLHEFYEAQDLLKKVLDLDITSP